MKLALFGFGVQPVFPEAPKHLANMFLVLSLITGVCQNVVEVHHNANIEQVYKDGVHESLEGCWCIGQPEGHDTPLIGAISDSEGCLPFIIEINYKDVNQMYCELNYTKDDT